MYIHLIKTLLVSWIRSGLFLLFLIVISIPVSVLTVVLLSIEALQSIQSILLPGDTIIGYMITSNYTGYGVPVRVEHVSIIMEEKRLDDVLMITLNKTYFEILMREHMIIYQGNISEGILIGERLALILGFRNGSNVTVEDNEGEIVKSRVLGVYSGLPQLTYIVICINNSYKPNMFLKITRDNSLKIMVRENTKVISDFLTQLLIALLLIYTPILYIGYAWVINRSGNLIELIHGIGVPLNIIGKTLTIVSMIYSLVAVIYGLALGKVIYDSSLLFLENIGFTILLPRSVPSIDYVVLISLYYALTSSVLTYIIYIQKYGVDR